MQNFQGIIFIRTQIYREIFKYALLHLLVNSGLKTLDEGAFLHLPAQSSYCFHIHCMCSWKLLF